MRKRTIYSIVFATAVHMLLGCGESKSPTPKQASPETAVGLPSPETFAKTLETLGYRPAPSAPSADPGVMVDPSVAGPHLTMAEFETREFEALQGRDGVEAEMHVQRWSTAEGQKPVVTVTTWSCSDAEGKNKRSAITAIQCNAIGDKALDALTQAISPELAEAVRAAGESDSPNEMKGVGALLFRCGAPFRLYDAGAACIVIDAMDAADLAGSAIRAIQPIGEKVEPALRAVVQDKGRSHRVRTAALYALRDVDTDSALDAVIATLDDPEPVLRTAAARALGSPRVFHRVALDAEVAVAIDPSVEISGGVQDAPKPADPKQETRKAKVNDALLKATGDASPAVRAAAIHALAARQVESDAFVDAVVKQLGAMDPAVRYAAISAAERVKPAKAQAVPVLRKLAAEAKGMVRVDAAKALLTLEADKPAALAALLATLREGEEEAAKEAIAQLGASELGVEALAALVAMANDEKTEARAMACLKSMNAERKFLGTSILALAEKSENAAIRTAAEAARKLLAQ